MGGTGRKGATVPVLRAYRHDASPSRVRALMAKWPWRLCDLGCLVVAMGMAKNKTRQSSIAGCLRCCSKRCMGARDAG